MPEAPLTCQAVACPAEITVMFGFCMECQRRSTLAVWEAVMQARRAGWGVLDLGSRCCETLWQPLPLPRGMHWAVWRMCSSSKPAGDLSGLEATARMSGGHRGCTIMHDKYHPAQLP